ncbi:hypothetical protein [Roseovarius sp. MMSF_3350]|uniref:hypothetical protein n=1 Tax=Roseovarius sp. MMSF_3350 TaxID=3046706 RepID=UPI00273E631F|nr:hypothetical protein [Roseovarius sp. MMSF_3350]
MAKEDIKVFEDTSVTALIDETKQPIWLRRYGGYAKALIWDNVSRTVDHAVKTGFKAVRAVWASEDIFYGHRDQQDYVEGDFSEIERRVVTRNSIPEIVADKDYESLVLRFRELVATERVAHNLLLSKWHKSDINRDQTASAALENIEQHGWQNLLSFQKFFTIKAILCLNKSLEGYDFNENTFHEEVLDEKEIRQEYLRQNIKLLFAEAAETLCESPEEFRAFVESTVEGLVDDTPPPDLPSKAPKLYRDRTDKSQKPVDFIKTVYEKWLGKGLLRPHIKQLDEALYRALYKHGIPEEFDTLLPKAPGKSARVKNLSEEQQVERRRAQARERNKRMYHFRKQKA